MNREEKEQKNEKAVSRRGFLISLLGGLAAGAIAGAATGYLSPGPQGPQGPPGPPGPPGPQGPPGRPAEPVVGEEEHDIVVVGAGTAGLSAAIEAHDLGADVVVLEKMDKPSGNSIYAVGIVAGLSRYQKEAGIEDSKELFFKDWMEYTQGMAIPELVNTYIDNISDAIDWLTNLGVKWQLPLTVSPPPMRGRGHTVIGGGLALVNALLEAANKRGIKILYNHKAVRLLWNEKMEVVGVRVLTPQGLKDFKARGGVILTYGGFHANQDYVTAYMGGDVARMPYRGSPYNTGDLMESLKQLGAKLIWLDQFHAGPIEPRTKINPVLVIENARVGVIVNVQGLRYVDEGETYVMIAKATAKQPLNKAFVIVDSEGAKNTYVANIIKQYRAAGVDVPEANTIEELAGKMGVPPENLRKTIDEYNRAVREGREMYLSPPCTQRLKVTPVTIEKPPFYAIVFSGGITATFGGPLINTKAQVLNTEDKPIPGLYAAGNAAAGLFFYNYIGGTQLGACVVFGRIAARDAVARAKAKG